MKKALKYTLIGIASLILLLLIAAIAIPFLFRDKIEALVKEQVNANLNATVDWTDLDLTLFKSFPDLTVEMEGLKVCNLAPFEGTCLADIGKFSCTLDIKSLFGDRIDVKRVDLLRPVLYIKVLEDGRANYDIAKVDSTATPEETAADTASAFNVGLRGYSLMDGHIIYDDASLPFLLDLAGVRHTGNGDFTQDLFVLRTVTHVDSVNVVYDGVKYLRHAVADITAELDMDMPNMKFTFKDNVVQVNQLGVELEGWLAMPGDDIEMDFTWRSLKTDFSTLLSLVPAEFAKDLEGVQISGATKFEGYVKGVYNDNMLPGFGLQLNVDNGRFKYPDLPASVENIFVDLNISDPPGQDMDRMVVDLKRFAMKLADNPIEARMYLTHPISDPNIDADLRAQLDLANIAQVVPMEKGDMLKGSITADVRLKGRMSDIEAQRYDKFTAEGKTILLDLNYTSDSLPYDIGIKSMYLNFSPRYLELASYEGSVGSSAITANGRMDNYLQWWLQDSALTGSFNLSANKFDLNELMGGEETTATADAAAVDTTALSLIEVPRNVDFRLKAQVKEVKYGDMTLADCKGDLHVHDEMVHLSDVFFRLFGGTVTMDGRYNTQDKAHPRVALQYDVRDLDIAETVKYVDAVKKMAPIAKTCTGKFSTDLSMEAELDQAMAPIMSSLTGSGTLRTGNVNVSGFQPLVDIAKALKIAELSSTKLQDIKFAYRFKDGKMITDPFDVKIDRIQANVGGSTAFADQAIDYDMKAKVPSDMFGAGAAQLVSGLLGQANQAIGANMQMPDKIDVTLKITGTVDKPIVKPVFAGGSSSIKETIKEEVKQQLNEGISRAKEEAIAAAKAQRDKLVAEAQAQADRIKADARKEAARIKGEAYAAADKLVKDASNPIAKIAAQKAAELAKKEADKKEQQFIADADKRADGVVKAAQDKGDQLVEKAENTDTTVK